MNFCSNKLLFHDVWYIDYIALTKANYAHKKNKKPQKLAMKVWTLNYHTQNTAISN